MIERKLKAHYIDCSFEKGLGLWVRIGADLDSYVVDLQPDYETFINIHGTQTFRHHGYAPHAEVETFYARMNKGEEVSGGLAYLFMYLQNMIDKQEYGGTCGLTSITEVNLWEPAGADGAYVAYKQYCYVTPFQYGGGTDGYQIPFEVSYIGARVKGTFIPKTYNETGEFIPETDGRYGLITKHIIKNATYNAADDNAIGYSQVVVEIPDTPVIVKKKITENGTYNSSDDEANGYDVVEVDVQPDLETRTITTNGTYSPTAGNDGFSEVTVDVQPNIEPLEITENGTYDAGDGVDGYAPVTVDIQPKLEALEATHNGRYTPSQGNDGFSVVDINVAGGGSQEAGTLIEKNITANGTYNPQSEYADGYSLVRVNVNPTLLTKTFTENGTYHASSDNADGYATVNVNVDTTPDLEVLEVSENHKTFNPSAGKDGFSQVRVDITSNVQSLTVSQNGEYLPPAGMDGFSKVTVDVDGSGGVVTQIEDSLYFSETGSAIVLKEIDITEDGTYSPEEGVNGFSRVNVNTGGEGHLIEKTITENGTYTPSSDDANGYSKVTVNVPNSFNSRDEGMVVVNGELVNQTSRMVTENGTYNTTENRQITVNVAGGGGGGSDPILMTKNVTMNGTYRASSDNVDGYDVVNVDVANTYGIEDEGKVVKNGQLASQQPVDIYYNGTYDVSANSTATVQVTPKLEEIDVTENGTYTPSEGKDGLSKVVVDVQLALQSKTVKTNGLVVPDSGYAGLSSVYVDIDDVTITLEIDSDGFLIIPDDYPVLSLYQDENGYLIIPTYKKTDLYVTENGTYLSDNNDGGFWKVVVDVDGMSYIGEASTDIVNTNAATSFSLLDYSWSASAFGDSPTPETDAVSEFDLNDMAWRVQTLNMRRDTKTEFDLSVLEWSVTATINS